MSDPKALISSAITDIDLAVSALDSSKAKLLEALNALDQPDPDAPLWMADMSTGDLSQWTEGGTGGFYNTNSGVESYSPDYGGSLKMTVTANNPPTNHAVRAFAPWLYLRENREATYLASFIFPKRITLTGPSSSGQFLNLFQFKSKKKDGSHNDPIFSIVLDNYSDGLYPKLVWGNTAQPGPHKGDPEGWKQYPFAVRTPIPVGEKIVFKAFLRQSSDYDGALQIWQDDVLVIDLSDVKTSWPFSGENDWDCHNEWSVNNYTDGATPAPCSIFVDYAEIRA